MQISIEPGEIRVASVDNLLDEPYAKVWYVDLDSKYAEVLAVSTREVLLHASERTLRLDESSLGRPTALLFDLPDEWEVIVDCARYTCRIVAYQTNRMRLT